MKPRNYIVAHNRDRDYYQVALALAEAGRLHSLVTDYYSDNSRRGFDRWLSHRSTPEIKKEQTRGSTASVLMQAACMKSPYPKLRRMGLDTVDRIIGRRVRREALSTPNVDLLLYSNSAVESFEEPELTDRRKYLFMYHPHPTLIREILEPDVTTYNIGHSGLLEESGNKRREELLNRELKAADKVFCASELTARSVIRAGVTKNRVAIIPYGIMRDLPTYADERSTTRLRFLFVGQAIHRKGVHHLLEGWRQANLPNAELVLVCSRAQDGLLDSLPKNVVLKSGLSTKSLWELYCSSHCFVLPSLVEGFGLVLFEAMGAGCFTIFTENTGFAGIEIPSTAGKQIESGTPIAISQAMTEVAEQFESGKLCHQSIKNLVQTYSAKRFRSSLRDSLTH